MKIVNLSKPFYLISDTHFWHSRLAFDFGLRTQFKSIEEMNATIFNNWNNIVSDDDNIIFLGDFVIGHSEKYKVAQIIHDSLNGYKVYIKGNHDEHLKESTSINVIDGPIEVRYAGKRILLNHEPIQEFEQDILIHGHVHKSSQYHYKQNCFNVSCEVIDYTPIHIDKILEDFQLDPFKILSKDVKI